MTINDVDMEKVTPMMRQYIEIKKQYQDVILFFRLGDFYEMFFEDAETAAHELEIALTGKNAGLDHKIPMCGIPHHAAEVYLTKLVDKGYKVGICEQIEDPKDAKGVVRRDVIQVVSKGTVMNDSLKETDNNFIGNVVAFKDGFGLSFCDISTGEFYTTFLENNITKLINEIINNGLNEVVLTDKVDKAALSLLKKQFQLSVSVYDEIEEHPEYKQLYTDLKDLRLVETVKHLLSYLCNTQKRNLPHLQKVVVKDQKNYLKMDVHTKSNLELVETLRLKQRNYSLLWLLDKTKTAMGSRKLKAWIESPLINKEEIIQRQTVVETFLSEFILKEDLKNYLYEMYDLERLTGRIAYGNANAKDMLQLKTSLKVLPNIKQILAQIHYPKTIETLEELYELLEKSIYENPPLSIKEGFLIKEGYHQELDELKDLRKGGKDFLNTFQNEERERTGIKNLKVGYNKVFGYYIEVSQGNIQNIKEEFGYERKQTLANSERYITPVLKEKESLILGAEEKIIALEYKLFTEIREEVKGYISRLQDIAKVISEIDVLQAFSTVTEENNYVKPIISDNKIIDIENNRHPVVEAVINSEFVPNDIKMDANTNILLITGPNMAGKSTYMRQLAITCIMNQIGCFVPCSKCIIPIFDSIFTRIGASDDLVSGESTFMVEMKEAKNALKNATENSLILFDELGRGTATFDGMSLAQAIIEYIHNHIHCKTIFSTHYHELTDLDKTLPNLKNIHVSAHEEDGNITFLHKIKDGSVDKSYGIHVAKIAGMPNSVLKRAEEILKVYENKEQTRDLIVQTTLPLEEPVQEESKIEAELKDLNLMELTPIDALNILYQLKEKL